MKGERTRKIAMKRVLVAAPNQIDRKFCRNYISQD